MRSLGRLKDAWRCLCGDRPSRNVLPQRRDCEHLTFDHEGHQWVASYGLYEDGRLAEIFLTSNKSGSKVEAYAQDAAVATSIACQHGASPQDIRAALMRDSRGEPHGPLGRALDIILGGQT